MSVSSCIAHPRGRYITIWDHYLDMVEDDYCSAALLSAFEFLCSGEMTRLGLEMDSDVCPWFAVDVDEIKRCMLRLYSDRTIHESTRFLESTGLIEVEQRGLGKRNRYRFRHDLVQDALKNRFVFDRKIAPSVDRKKAAELPFSPICIYEEGRMKNEDYNHQPPTEQENYKQPEQLGKPEALNNTENCVDIGADWMQNLWREVFARDLHMTQKDRRWVEETLMPKFPDLSDLRAKMEDYCAQPGKPALPGFQEFLGMAERKMGLRRQPAEFEAGTGRHPFARREWPTDATRRLAPRSTVTTAPVLASVWNEEVPDRKWTVWDMKLGDAWGCAMDQSEFSINYVALLKKCSALVKTEHGSNVNFPYFLKNWTGILNGTHDWMLKGKSTKTSAAESVMAEARRLSKERFANESNSGKR